jgi:lysophospholipase L1-like esterase
VRRGTVVRLQSFTKENTMRARGFRRAALTLCSVTPLSALPGALSAQNTALIPAPFQQERHEQFLEEARAGAIECLLMGDSITDWWRRAGGELYGRIFEPLGCANFGIAGDRTQGVLWRMDNGELEGYSPRLMMLMIGTNNLSGRRSTPNTPAEIAMAIATIVAKFRTTFPDAKVLLLGVFPRGAEPTNPYRESIREINELIADLDDGEYVRFMDIGDSFLEPDGSISEEVMPDGLHPSTRGYEIWAEAVMPTFREMMGR